MNIFCSWSAFVDKWRSTSILWSVPPLPFTINGSLTLSSSRICWSLWRSSRCSRNTWSLRMAIVRHSSSGWSLRFCTRTQYWPTWAMWPSIIVMPSSCASRTSFILFLFPLQNWAEWVKVLKFNCCIFIIFDLKFFWVHTLIMAAFCIHLLENLWISTLTWCLWLILMNYLQFILIQSPLAFYWRFKLLWTNYLFVNLGLHSLMRSVLIIVSWLKIWLFS